MALSQQQLADEKRRYTEYNKLFTTVIKYTPFAKFYPLMIGASNLLTKNLPNRVGIDANGRPVVVYKGDIGKVLGVWAVPEHQLIAEDFAEKKYGRGLLEIFFPIDQLKNLIQQRSIKNIIFDISAGEVKQIQSTIPVPSKPIAVSNQPKIVVPAPSLSNKVKWGTYKFNNY